MVEKIKLKNFTIFKDNELEFSPNINILMGKNSTGKSLLMKIIYSVIETLSLYGEEKNKETIGYEISKKIEEVFLIPKIGKLSTRMQGNLKTEIKIDFDHGGFIDFSFSTRSKKAEINDIYRNKIRSATYIPTKEIVSLMDRGFIGLYEKYKFMEGVYYDLAKKLDKPVQLGAHDKKTKKLLKSLNLPDLTRIYRKDSEFFTYIKGVGNLESKLVAEGFRKLMILIYLIKNGEFTNGEYLFWDEPEVNLNPALSRAVVELLIFLSKEFNTQVFIATHDYFLIKYFDMIKQTDKSKANFDLKYFLLFTDKDNSLKIESTDKLYKLEHNPILEEFEVIYNFELDAIKKEIAD